MRTTIDLDPSVLRGLKARAATEGKSLGRLASELLAPALAQTGAQEPPPFRWVSRPMGFRVDLEDKEAIRRALDGR
jgi:plasmid stability protein